ncbi:MAG: phage scaffolding protein [Clostridia bacterium]|nr:phage scaffolding protein [Clostridia bacterium]
MNKERLIEHGVEASIAEKIAAEIAEEMKGFVPKARFDEVNTAKKNAEEAAAAHKQQLEELKKAAGDNEGLKKQIEELQQKNSASEEAHKVEIHQLKLDAAVAAELASANCLNQKAARALLNLEKAEFAEDGKVKGLAEQVKALVAAEDSKMLFGTGTPAMKGAKLGQSPDKGGASGADLSKMSYAELSAYFEAHPDAAP